MPEPNRNTPAPQRPGEIRLINADVSSLPVEQQAELAVEATKLQLELDKRAAGLAIENQALDGRLNSAVDAVASGAKDGISATVTGSYQDSMGRTEIIVGNTETAAKGKLNNAQRGAPDLTLWYVAIGAALIVFLVLILSR